MQNCSITYIFFDLVLAQKNNLMIKSNKMLDNIQIILYYIRGVKRMELEHNIKKGIAFAILAAALYAINAPFSKILLDYMPPTLMAGFLYVGAGIGMVFIALIRKIQKKEAKESKLTRAELPYCCCSRCRFCGIWIEHLLLCVCTAVTWCSTNKCLLCDCPVYSGDSIADYI